jgi:hypothetical protein
VVLYFQVVEIDREDFSLTQTTQSHGLFLLRMPLQLLNHFASEMATFSIYTIHLIWKPGWKASKQDKLYHEVWVPSRHYKHCLPFRSRKVQH